MGREDKTFKDMVADRARNFFLEFPVGTTLEKLKNKLGNELKDCLEKLKHEGNSLKKVLSENYRIKIAGLHWMLPGAETFYFVTDIGLDDEIDKLIESYSRTWAKLRPGELHLSRLIFSNPFEGQLYFRLYNPVCENIEGRENNNLFVIPKEVLNCFLFGEYPVFQRCDIEETLVRAKEYQNNTCKTFWKDYQKYLNRHGLGKHKKEDLYRSFFLSSYVTFSLISDKKSSVIFDESSFADVLFMPISIRGYILAVVVVVCSENLMDKAVKPLLQLVESYAMQLILNQYKFRLTLEEDTQKIIFEKAYDAIRGIKAQQFSLGNYEKRIFEIIEQVFSVPEKLKKEISAICKRKINPEKKKSTPSLQNVHNRILSELEKKLKAN